MEIKFLEYSGAWPNLCSGVLVLQIDGEVYTFGERAPYEDETRQFPRFWSSGGSVNWDPEEIVTDEWRFDGGLPDFLKGHEQELIDLFNSNVIWGCCGGCI